MQRRLPETFDLDAITALNERTDHAEMRPPYVAAYRGGPSACRPPARDRCAPIALDLHSVIRGPLEDIPAIKVTGGGSTGREAHGELTLLAGRGFHGHESSVELSAGVLRPESVPRRGS